MARVLIVAFDGLQPSQVRADLAPNLSTFAAGGVTFARNHPVFPTVTRINVATLVTGRHPGSHGLAGNTFVIRDYDPNNTLQAMEPQLVQVAEQTGHVLLAPTLADILHDHGEEYVAVGVGTSGNAYVQNPRAEALGGATIHPEFCLPGGLHDQLVERFGPWPAKVLPNAPQMEHAVRVLTEYVLAERDPAVALIWFSEPDSSNHKAGVGSVLSNSALASADEQFGRIIGWMERNGALEETDVIVVSDHGYATIEDIVDIEAELRAAGFPNGGQPGGVLVAPNGGASLFYAHEADPETVVRLATWLARQPWCGAMLDVGTRRPCARHAPREPRQHRRSQGSRPGDGLRLELHSQRRRLSRPHSSRRGPGRRWHARWYDPPRTAEHAYSAWTRFPSINCRRNAHGQH